MIKEVQKNFIKSDQIDNGVIIVNSIFDTYETKETYYLPDENGSLKKIKLKISDVYELYPDFTKKHTADLDSYCKSKNISKIPSEKQMTELLAFMSEIRAKNP